ncbi:helix-turn-helix domain-containing protein [Marinomonas epiphytica]
MVKQNNCAQEVSNMDIGEVAKSANIPVSTIRYYEEKQLNTPLGRKGLRRYFSPKVVDRLALIALGRSAGLSLDEIRGMLLTNNVDIDRKLLLEKADELDKQITQMLAVRDGLRNVAACEAPSHLECSKFQRLMKLASKRWPRKKHQV